MRRKIHWEHDAVEDLFELTVANAKQARRVMIVVRSYGMGASSDLKKLSDGTDRWRLRSGDWRILLRLYDDVAAILEVKNRREVYD